MLKLPHIANRFRQVLKSKLATSCITNTASIDDDTSGINRILIEAGKETIPKNSKKFDAWISSNTLELVTYRRNIPRHRSEKRKDFDKLIKTSFQKDREAYWQGIAKDMEDANKAGNTFRLYQLLNKWCWKGLHYC